jgi:hypothetical protein
MGCLHWLGVTIGRPVPPLLLSSGALFCSPGPWHPPCWLCISVCHLLLSELNATSGKPLPWPVTALLLNLWFYLRVFFFPHCGFELIFCEWYLYLSSLWVPEKPSVTFSPKQCSWSNVQTGLPKVHIEYILCPYVLGLHGRAALHISAYISPGYAS